MQQNNKHQDCSAQYTMPNLCEKRYCNTCCFYWTFQQKEIQAITKILIFFTSFSLDKRNDMLYTIY